MSRRFSVGQLMALTGVIALNLAVVGASTRVMDLFVGVYLCGPILIGVQLALLRPMFGFRARRPFWLGFAASGTMAAVALFWAYFFTPLQGELLRIYAAFWEAFDWIAPGIDRLVSSHEWSIHVAFTLYHFVPQLIVAFAGGALVNRLARAGDPELPEAAA